MRPATPLPAACALLFLAVPPRLAPHERITQRAARSLGWSRRACRHLRRAVRAVDLDEMVCNAAGGSLSVATTEAYDPAHHCDRPAGASHRKALEAARRHVRRTLEEAVRLAREGAAEEALDALGRALHTVQDAYSHTDAAERGVQAQDMDPHGMPPQGVRVTAFDCHAEQPGLPDDAFPHDEHAKDIPLHNDASSAACGDGTAFDAARELAVCATEKALQSFRQAVGEDAWHRLQHPPHWRLRSVARRNRPKRMLLTFEASRRR
ncbi:MAG TPA: hypothetical protein VFH47_07170 [Candidatus Thermoplasmatota archaeon]|nr:hypothetical protein [Candidatus Thermoplasmatota archaeon]